MSPHQCTRLVTLQNTLLVQLVDGRVGLRNAQGRDQMHIGEKDGANGTQVRSRLVCASQGPDANVYATVAPVQLVHSRLVCARQGPDAEVYSRLDWFAHGRDQMQRSRWPRHPH